MKPVVDKDACVGCGLCAGVAPEVFVMEDDGKAGAASAEVCDCNKDAAQEAADSCPVSAITLE